MNPPKNDNTLINNNENIFSIGQILEMCNFTIYNSLALGNLVLKKC